MRNEVYGKDRRSQGGELRDKMRGLRGIEWVTINYAKYFTRTVFYCRYYNILNLQYVSAWVYRKITFFNRPLH